MFESISIPNFFDQEEVTDLIDKWTALEGFLLESRFNTTRDQAKICVMHGGSFYEGAQHSPGLITSLAALHEDGTYIGDEEIGLAGIYVNWLEEYSLLLQTRLAEHGRPAQRVRVSIFNFHQGFETHCDSLDMDEIVKHMSRDDPLLNERVKLLVRTARNVPTHQGLINLAAPADHGTTIFDQTFPISVYCDYGKTGESRWSTGWGPYKSTIQFYKGDEPERYGYKIKDFTHEFMPEDQYKQVTSLDSASFTKRSSYGLTLEKELLYGKPGNFISWDCTKFHRPKPFKKLPRKEAIKHNRLCFQYEAST